MEYGLVMPRQPRLDAPGTLHHVMSRGIEGVEIFRNKIDREDFLARFLGVTTSAVIRSANSEDLPEVENYL